MRATTFISLAILTLLPALLIAAPASAATKAQKMETCTFGADHDGPDGKKLEGKARNAFIAKCMSGANYEPAARKDALKRIPPKKKPAMAPPANKP